MRIVLESMDVEVASPATISRNGMVARERVGIHVRTVVPYRQNRCPRGEKEQRAQQEHLEVSAVSKAVHVSV